VICICAEQTFTQASTKERRFAEDFSIALDAYLKAAIRADVNKAIRALLGGKDSLDEFLLRQLVDIIMNHRLRMWLFFECEQLCP
jgi:hypothetical protein